MKGVFPEVKGVFQEPELPRTKQAGVIDFKAIFSFRPKIRIFYLFFNLILGNNLLGEYIELCLITGQFVKKIVYF